MENTEITDDGLKDIAQLQNLVALELGGTKITDKGLSEVAELQNLKLLNLNGTKITDTGLKALVQLPNLESLFLLHTQITDEGAAVLTNANAKLEIYKLDSPRRILSRSPLFIPLSRRRLGAKSTYQKANSSRRI